MRGVIILVFTCFLAFCTYYSPEIEEVLKQAGSNRPELEKVLKHYSKNPAGALGIPATVEFTPKWPNNNAGHAWNSVCDSSGIHICRMSHRNMTASLMLKFLVLSEEQYNGKSNEGFYRSGWSDTMDVNCVTELKDTKKIKLKTFKNML